MRSDVNTGDTVGQRNGARHYDPPARRIPESRRVGAHAARTLACHYVDELLQRGELDRVVTYLAPLVARLDGAPARGPLATVLSDAALVDDGQDVARERFRRGEITAPQYRYHLHRQLAHTYAELSALGAP